MSTKVTTFPVITCPVSVAQVSLVQNVELRIRMVVQEETASSIEDGVAKAVTSSNGTTATSSTTYSNVNDATKKQNEQTSAEMKREKAARRRNDSESKGSTCSSSSYRNKRWGDESRGEIALSHPKTLARLNCEKEGRGHFERAIVCQQQEQQEPIISSPYPDDYELEQKAIDQEGETRSPRNEIIVLPSGSFKNLQYPASDDDEEEEDIEEGGQGLPEEEEEDEILALMSPDSPTLLSITGAEKMLAIEYKALSPQEKLNSTKSLNHNHSQKEGEDINNNSIHPLQAVLVLEVPTLGVRTPNLMDITLYLQRIQEYFKHLGYHRTGEPKTSVNTRMSMKHQMDTARKLIKEQSPIKCLHALVLAIHFTNITQQIERFPINFRSHFNGREFKHVVLGIYMYGNFGALGISRDGALQDKPPSFSRLTDLISEYYKSYTESGHDLIEARIGGIITHDPHSQEAIPWKLSTINFRKTPPLEVESVVEKISRGLRAKMGSACLRQIRPNQYVFPGELIPTHEKRQRQAAVAAHLRASKSGTSIGSRNQGPPPTHPHPQKQKQILRKSI